MQLSVALARFPDAVHARAGEVAAANAAHPSTLVVLDDDPTGTQSVSDLPVLTRWDVSDFDWAFEQKAAAVYVLTNSRSLDEAEARSRNIEIVENATTSARALGLTVRFVSRSDSTLRGHFPLETDTIAETLRAATGEVIDGVVIVPAFPDAGRVTVGGVHYMLADDELTPVAETEFARDATFGYGNSDLASWVQEKSSGRIDAGSVIVLDLGIVRAGSAAIADAIAAAESSTAIVSDALTEDDLRLLSLGLIEAESRGKKLLYRVGPPFVRARIGQEQRAPLTAEEIFPRGSAGSLGGLIVVGSHVGVTTRQLARLRSGRPNAITIEVDVEAVIGSADPQHYLSEVAGHVIDTLASGDVIVHTSRLLVKTDDPAESLDISRRVSAAVVSVVRQAVAASSPRFVIAKGGITSSDVAAHGMQIRHAIVRGPMLPGIVSLWEPVDGPATGIPYIVFAGNVGDDESLASVVTTLSAL